MSQVEGIILGNNSCDQLSSKDETGVRQSHLPLRGKGTFSRISDNFFLNFGETVQNLERNKSPDLIL